MTAPRWFFFNQPIKPRWTSCRVATQLLEQAGFKVEMQSMDCQTLLSRRARKDGWNIFTSRCLPVSSINPISNMYLAASGLSHSLGRVALRSGIGEAARRFRTHKRRLNAKRLPNRIQVRAMEIGVYVPLGEYVGKSPRARTSRAL